MPTQTFFNLNEEKRERIIQVALNEFAYKPYEKVNVTDIIEKSNIARGSFYQYFSGLADLYNYLIEHGSEIKQKYVNKHLEGKQLSSMKDFLMVVFKAGLEYAEFHPEYTRMFSLMIRDSESSDVVSKEFSDRLKMSEQIYIDLINQFNALPDADMEELRFTAHLLTKINIIFVDYYLENLIGEEVIDRDELSKRYIDKLFNGFLEE
jgi:AcrR family transcriptional regulator